MKSALDLVNDIDGKAKALYKSLDSPEDISKILFEMAILSVGLGNYLIEALDNERRLDSKYKYDLVERKLELVSKTNPSTDKLYSATVAESIAEQEISNEALLESKRQVDILKIKRADLEKVIDTGRSRLSLIKNDIRKETP